MAGIRGVLVDWAGTVTVPLREVVLRVRADEVVLIDDMTADVGAARAHGLHAIAVGDDPTEAIDELSALVGPAS